MKRSDRLAHVTGLLRAVVDGRPLRSPHAVAMPGEHQTHLDHTALVGAHGALPPSIAGSQLPRTLSWDRATLNGARA